MNFTKSPITNQQKFDSLLLRLEKLLSAYTSVGVAKSSNLQEKDKAQILELQNKNLQDEILLLKTQLFEANKEIHALKKKNEGAKQELSNIISELELCQK